MPFEFIDLNESPPPPSSSSEAPRILNSSVASIEQMQFEKASMPLWTCPNPNFCYTNQQQATMFPTSRNNYEPSQIDIRFNPCKHGDQVTSVLEPVLESNLFQFSDGSRLEAPWTPREQELFLMGVMKYGRRQWTKIAQHFLKNKTPWQVQKYGAKLFRHIPATHIHTFKRRNPTCSSINLKPNNNKLTSSSATYSMPSIANEPQQNLLLLSKEVPFFSIPLYGESSNSTTTTTYGFQMQTSVASNYVTASGNGEVDLELHLG